MQTIAETCVRFDAAHLSINLVLEIAVPMFPTFKLLPLLENALKRGNHAQSIANNGDQKEDKTLQHSQLSQHGEFRHVSVCERQ